MADTIVDRYESALKMLANIAGKGGYIRKETREEMQNVVSIIRNCFIEITRTAGDKMRKEGKFEVIEDELEYHCVEGDSCNMGLVAPSIEETQNEVIRLLRKLKMR